LYVFPLSPSSFITKHPQFFFSSSPRLTFLFQSFLSSQLIFSFLPLVLFTIFALSTVAFAVGGAILFALFWIGIALLVLIPTLFITASIGVLVWAWAAGSFVIVRAVYRRVAAYNNNNNNNAAVSTHSGKGASSAKVKAEQNGSS
jgi:membrane protein implicated in regulation of membrane protease activity